MRKSIITLTGAALLLALSACSSIQAESKSSPSPSASSQGVGTPTPPGVEESAPAETPEDLGPSTAAFGQTWEYEDGIAITVTMGAARIASQTAAGAEATGGEYREFTVTVENHTKRAFDPSLTLADVNYGPSGTKASRVFDIQSGIGDSFQGSILPGKRQTVVFGFAIPAKEKKDIVMSISPSFKHEDVLYTTAG